MGSWASDRRALQLTALVGIVAILVAAGIPASASIAAAYATASASRLSPATGTRSFTVAERPPRVFTSRNEPPEST